jgi:hypothetical protein
MMLWSWLPVLSRGVHLLTFEWPCAGRGYSTLEFAMNIELDEVVVQDVTDDALELAAGAQGGCACGWSANISL